MKEAASVEMGGSAGEDKEPVEKRPLSAGKLQTTFHLFMNRGQKTPSVQAQADAKRGNRLEQPARLLPPRPSTAPGSSLSDSLTVSDSRGGRASVNHDFSAIPPVLSSGRMLDTTQVS